MIDENENNLPQDRSDEEIRKEIDNLLPQEDKAPVDWEAEINNAKKEVAPQPANVNPTNEVPSSDEIPKVVLEVPEEFSKPKEFSKEEKEVKETKKKHIPASGTTSLLNAGLFTNKTKDEVKNAINKYTSNLSTEEVEEVLQDIESWVTKLTVCELNNMNSANVDFWNQAIAEVRKTGDLLVEQIEDLKDSIASGSNFNNMLHGKAAELAFTASLQGLKKVYLYNSGFHVKIKPFSNAELNEFFLSVDAEKKEYGRMLGGHFYLVQDLFIKHKFMEVFPESVVDCNLKGWKNGNTLSKAISILDYETLIWAHCALMYRKGIEVPMVCANEECKHVSHGPLMDIDKFRITNNEKLSEDVIAFMKKEIVTKQECNDYTKNILNNSKEVFFRNIRLDLQVPSVHNVLEYGDDIHTTITANVTDEQGDRDEIIMAGAILNYNRCFVPWVNVVHYLNDDKSVKFSTMESSAISSVIEWDQGTDESNEMTKEIKAFMRKSKMSFICYQIPKCEKCGIEPSDELDKYQSWDAQDLFFVLSYRKIEPIR